MKNKGILILFIILTISVLLVAESDLRLINYAGEIGNDNESESISFYEETRSVIRFREVNLQDNIIDLTALEMGSEIILNLFPEREYRAVVDLFGTNINGTDYFRARIDSFELGYITMSTTEERSLARISIPERGESYSIISDSMTKQHFLLDIDAAEERVIEYLPVLIPEDVTPYDLQEEERIRRLQGRIRPDQPVTIDVVIAYTPAANSWANTSGGGINNCVSQAIISGQLVLDNSNTLMNLNLVYSAQVDYVESGNAGADLRRLTASPSFNPWGDYHDGYYIPGYMDEVHLWRDAYGADLVALFANVSYVGGVAWLLTNRNGNPNYGFSMTRIQQASGTSYTFIHELGHNMGLHHHAEQNVQPGPTNWTNWPQNNWSAGWRWTGTNNLRYCSVMTYTGGQYFPDGNHHARVPYFSNPQITYQGVPAGDPVLANNARTLREIREVIAAYRYTLEAPVVTISISQGNVILSWDPVENATSYLIYAIEDINSGDWGNPIAITEHTQHIESLSVRRFFRVVASVE